jgi:outer membrane receptor protein involved in Fe transport
MKGNNRKWTTRMFGLFSVLIVSLAGATAAFGQAETGQLTVKVADPQAAVISGATVTVKSDTGFSQTKTASDEGIATFTNLKPGFYEVSAGAKGFSDLTKKAEVTVGAKLEVVMSMSTGSVKESVTVVAGEGGIEVNTQSQELSTVVSGKDILELPSLTRNPYDFVALSGNVNEDPTASGRGVMFAINGQRVASTNILLDGGENVDYFGAAVGQSVPLESVNEFRIITSDFTAEYGRASGGIVNVTTKSGSNQYHGSVYEFNRISALASNSFSNNANVIDPATGRTIPRPVFDRNQFGYSFGGKIITDKLFFFSSTEWTRVRSGAEEITIVPTAQLLAASSANTKTYFAAFQQKVPINGTTYTAGQIAASAGLTSGAFASLPANMPAFGQAIYNVPADVGAGSPQNTYSTVNRIDWNISANTQLYGRYALENGTLFNGTVNTSPWVGFDTGQTTFNQNYLINLTHTFSSKLVSQSKVVYNRLNLQQPLGQAPAGPTLYLTGNSPSVLEGAAVALPGYNEFTPGAAIPFGGPQNLLQLYEDISYIKGNHNFRFGGLFEYIQDNRAFGAYEEATEQLGSNTAKGLNNFVTGQLFQFQAAVFPQGKFPGQSLTLPVGPPDFTRSNRYDEFALYAQDSWHVKPRLTLNLGVRYEYYGTQHNGNPSRESNFYFGSGSTIFDRIRNGSVQIANNSPIGGLWAASPLNFAPRVGFAWDIFGDGKTSVRGGYAIAYERNFGNVTFNVIQNPPNYAVIALQSPGDIPAAQNVITLSNSGPLAGSSGSKTLGAVTLRAVDPNIKQARAQLYSVSFQRQLRSRTLLSVEYSGSTGTNLYSIANINRSDSGQVFLGSAVGPFPAAARLNGQYGSINFRGSDGSSRYNGMIVSVENSGLGNTGLRFSARYTLSASRDDLSSTFSDGAAGNFVLGYTDPFNPKLDYGYSNFDQRHRLSVGFNWAVPFAKSMHGFAQQVLDGWEFTGIFVAHTGTPFTEYDCTNAFTVCSRLAPQGSVSFSGGGHFAEDPTQGVFDHVQYINLGKANPLNYANPISGTNDFGPYPASMTKRDAFRGPGFWNLDSGIYKNFRLTERFKLQFRAELYNMFNHANLFVNGTETDVSSTLLPDGTPFIPAHWDGSRNVQLALKVIF